MKCKLVVFLGDFFVCMIVVVVVVVVGAVAGVHTCHRAEEGDDPGEREGGQAPHQAFQVPPN